MRCATLAVSSAVLVLSCSSGDERPTPIGVSSPVPDSFGTGGGSGQGETGAAAGSNAGGTTGDDSGADVSGSGGAYVTGACATFDPDAVYLLGELWHDGNSERAVCALNQPRTFCTGFYGVEARFGPVIRPTDGALIYYSWADNKLRRFVPDGLEWNESGKTWRYPHAPQENDVVIPTPPCKAEDGLFALAVHPGDGRLIYQCREGTGPGELHYDQTGQVVGSSWMDLRAVGFDGTMLALQTDKNYGVTLVTPDGDETPVDGLPTDTVYAVRATSGGFWMVYDEAPQRWFVSNAGEAQLDGYYAPITDPDIDIIEGYAEQMLDASGNLYIPATRTGDSASNLLIKMGIPPETFEIVHDDSGLPKNGYEDWEKKNLAVRMHAIDFISGG